MPIVCGEVLALVRRGVLMEPDQVRTPPRESHKELCQGVCRDMAYELSSRGVFDYSMIIPMGSVAREVVVR